MYQRAFQTGQTFEEFLAGAADNRDLWLAIARRARVAPDIAERAGEVTGQWRLLVIADDWCGDAVNIVPVVAELADAVENVDLRIVGREAFPELMDRHLTNGSRSIPVVILLDEQGACRGWWGPRPLRLQSWFDAEGRALPKQERYRELRRWYARDRGSAITAEIAHLLRGAAARGTNDCRHARHHPSRAA